METNFPPVPGSNVTFHVCVGGASEREKRAPTCPRKFCHRSSVNEGEKSWPRSAPCARKARGAPAQQTAVTHSSLMLMRAGVCGLSQFPLSRVLYCSTCDSMTHDKSMTASYYYYYYYYAFFSRCLCRQHASFPSDALRRRQVPCPLVHDAPRFRRVGRPTFLLFCHRPPRRLGSVRHTCRHRRCWRQVPGRDGPGRLGGVPGNHDVRGPERRGRRLPAARLRP